MKKRMSKFMSLALATLLVVAMAVPVVALSGNDSAGQYTYSWSVTRTSTSGRATITATTVPATVGTAVQNLVYDEDGRAGYAYSSGSSSSGMNPVSSYVSAIANASNVFTYTNGRQYSGSVTKTHGYYWVNGSSVPNHST